jgi:hypothetical protein
VNDKQRIEAKAMFDGDLRQIRIYSFAIEWVLPDPAEEL